VCETTMMEVNYSFHLVARHDRFHIFMELPKNAKGKTLYGNEGIANMRQLAYDRRSKVSFQNMFFYSDEHQMLFTRCTILHRHSPMVDS
jgi:hypothetical protein